MFRCSQTTASPLHISVNYLLIAQVAQLTNRVNDGHSRMVAIVKNNVAIR